MHPGSKPSKTWMCASDSTRAVSAPCASSPTPPSVRAKVHASLAIGSQSIAGIAPARQLRTRRIERDGRVAARGSPTAQGEGRDPGSVGDELRSHQAGERRGAVVRHRHIEQHAPVARQQVPFPCRPHHGVPAPHEKAVAGVAQGPRSVRRRRVVEELELSLVAAVAVSEEEPAHARSHRLQDAHIGRVLDGTAGIARHLVEIHDLRVHGGLGIDGEVRTPDEALVGTGVPERMAARERLAFGDSQLQRVVHCASESCLRATTAECSGPSRLRTSSGVHGSAVYSRVHTPICPITPRSTEWRE